MLMLIPFLSFPNFPLSGVTNGVLIWIWNRSLLLGAESWTWGGRWGGEGRITQLVPVPEGPGIAERPRVGSGRGPTKLESWLVRLLAV